jgi:hypothetical protein
MKKLFPAIPAVLITLSALSQNLKESRVTAAIKAACEKNPAWKGVQIRMMRIMKLTSDRSNSMPALIENNGTIVEIETDIFVNDLLESVRKCTENHYAGIKIKEAAGVVNANGDTNYEAEANHKDVVFDANGKFIKEMKD